MVDAIVFLGIQGSGKGTQADLLAEKSGFFHLNMGDLLREESTQTTAMGKRIKMMIDKGEMVTDKMALATIAKALIHEYPGVIFDGFPRTRIQAEYLLKYFNLKRVYYLDLSAEDALSRIQGRRVCNHCGANFHLEFHPPQEGGICDVCGSPLTVRLDDNPEAAGERIRTFYEQTFMLKEYFQKLDCLKSVSAKLPILDIHSRILEDFQRVK